MAPLYVALIWHQHQPMYKSALTGQYLMPWVRLHGTKDYLDMALLLERYPKLHQTINLVPSLIQQIEETAKGKARDPWLECLTAPVLDREQKLFVLQRFFDAHWERMVKPYPRYAQLLDLTQEKGISWCLAHWSDSDFSDLLVWHNLCWFDPIFQEEDPQIRKWMTKGQGFTLAERLAIYSKQKSILSKILPKHRELQERGQLELTTTPYTHPILPLLADSASARVASPHMQLPHQPYQWPQDVDIHLERAQLMYKKRFGAAARGLWPSEQSVSPAIIPAVCKQGFQWLISDEGVLSRSLGTHWERDLYGHILQADQLYRPYQITTPAGPIQMIFRDRRLSDLMGFRYSDMNAQTAARDFIEQLEAVQRRLEAQEVTDQPHLVTIALDGENCWEYYERDGLPFLQTLYQMLSDHPYLKLVTVSEYLTQFPPTDTIPVEKLHSGSWINSDFAIWIGDPIKNKAWELLTEARELISQHPNPPKAALEALWAAEGSDWFWWFGKPHSSQHDYLFDQLFREHLQAIYTTLGRPVPAALLEPLEKPQQLFRQMPTPNLDGLGTDPVWQQAMSVDLGTTRGTMYQNVPISRLYYGMNTHQLFVRLDWRERPERVDFFFYHPGKTQLTSLIPYPMSEAPYNYRFCHQLSVFKGLSLLQAREYDQWFSQEVNACYGLADCLELAIPWQDLELVVGERVCWVVLVHFADQRILPVLNGVIEMEIPQDWQRDG
ncbi:glycoside hydrolase family 57 protein [Candidatus Cyanaurora vandensis]|uniref:glycoside hydrolase family 57 protein n=1 Tax=Candidatus Cyanaurora vandensis TaxID=2714958 RepID=UPI002581110B|nr:glycoside hydrolase family 57 protein [Candidatus Cyanaurora vandensis]